MTRAGFDNLQWANLPGPDMGRLVSTVTVDAYQMNGKTTFKEEFVTAGGLVLKQVDFRTMQLKAHPALYACGEVLDVDGITGGFNFQAAWTTGYLAGKAAGEYANA